MDRKEMSRIIAIKRHRRNKNLCENCGLDIHTGECIENYTKTDMHLEFPQELKYTESEPNESKKRETIISYRRRKNLCLLCGHELHDGSCEVTYEQADNRPEEEKIERPAIISTKIERPPTILETLNSGDTIDYEPSKKIITSRPYILIDYKPSRLEKIIEFNAITQLAKIHQDFIVFVMGEFVDILVLNSLRKYPSISQLKNLTDIERVNYISGCRLFYSYPSKFTSFSIIRKIPTALFDENKSVTSFLKNVNYVN